MSSKEDTPSPADVVALFSFHYHKPPDIHRRLDEWICTDPRLAEAVARLDELARDAGYSDPTPDNLAKSYEAHEQLEELVATEGWERPEEILDPDMGWGWPRETPYNLKQIYRLLEARLAGAEGRQKRRLEEVRAKLRRSCGREQLEKLAERRPVADAPSGPGDRSATPELTMEEIVELLDWAETAEIELEYETAGRWSDDYERDILRARWLRADPRVAGPIRLLEAMAADAGIDGLARAYERHRALDGFLAGEEIEVRIAEIEIFVEFCRIIAARLARSEDRGERENLLRVRESLERMCGERVTIDFIGQPVSVSGFAGYLEDMPLVSRIFLRPFRRLLAAEDTEAPIVAATE